MRTLTFLLLLFPTLVQGQQQLPRQIVVEHFTNTWCSVCAGRNPGFFDNLATAPDVLHLGIYPSAPYKGCPLSQYAPADQDARTRLYGIYGSTPRLVVNGAVLDAASAYTSPAIFSAHRGEQTSFQLRLELRRLDSTTGELRTVLYKRDTSSLDTLLLYGVLAQDTIRFAAKNGEAQHYNVFRKSIWGSDPLPQAAPRAVGDSTVFRSTFAVDAAWDASRVAATVLAQRRDLRLEQAARSGALPVHESPMHIPNPGGAPPLVCFPVPAGTRLYINSPDYCNVRVVDLAGRTVLVDVVTGTAGLDVSRLPTGAYIIHVQHAGTSGARLFLKQ